MTEDEFRDAQIARDRQRDEFEREIRQAQLRLDEARFKRENRFLNRHVATIVSLLAVFVAATQLWFGVKKDDRDRSAQALRDDREGQRVLFERAITISRLLSERHDDLFSSDPNDREQFRSAILLDLPPDAGAKVRAYFRDHAINRPDAVLAARVKGGVLVDPGTPATTGNSTPIKPTAPVPEPLEFQVPAVDDRIRIISNGTVAYEGPAIGWQKLPISLGRNLIEIQVFNQASYTGGVEILGGHKREGWNYHVEIRQAGQPAQTFSDRRDEPPADQFGTWFPVRRLNVTVDPATGLPVAKEFLTPA